MKTFLFCLWSLLSLQGAWADYMLRNGDSYWFNQNPPPLDPDAVQPLEDRILRNLARDSTLAKKLNDIQITVYGSTVIVSGAVDNETQRSKVLALTRQTNGVINVQDALFVRSNPKPLPNR